MYSYRLYYSGLLLRDSADIDDYYESEEDAYDEAEIERDNRIERWKLDGAWNAWDNIEAFDIKVDEI